MKLEEIVKGIENIAKTMEENKLYLVKLDQQNGDGDLGISMSNGFAALADYFKNPETNDIGRLFNKAADRFNEAAPSSLGTIIAFIMKGMARELKGKEGECSIEEMAKALRAGLNNVSAKTGSKPGQKTIIDSLDPAITVLENNFADANVWQQAYAAAKEGSENTKNMRAVWGRAAYYGDASIGIVDGGSVVGSLIFESLK